MDRRSLQTFRTVAETGSVSAAAGRLHCVQSAVTARIRRLEEEIGVMLFRRSRRGMRPTPAGEVLLDYAVRVLRLLDSAERAMRDLTGNGGLLRLGTMETTLAARLPPLLAAFRRRHPEVRLRLSSGPTDDLLRALLADELDAALVGGRVQHPELLAEPVFVEEMVLVMPPGVRDPAALEDRLLFVFRRGCAYRAFAEQWLRRSGLAPVEIAELGTLEGILGCVAAGLGLTLLPRSVAARPPYRDLLTLRSLAGGGPLVTVLCHHRDRPAGRALEGFRDLLRSGSPAVRPPP